MDLVQLLDPGRTEPLYIVTGKVTSSSWATATYSEPLIAPNDALVLTRFFRGLPPYRWTEPGNARNWSKSSSNVNPQGERASDQCLFLRGFLVTPSPKRSRQAGHALKTNDSHPNTSGSNTNLDTIGRTSGQVGSSNSTCPSQLSGRSGVSREVSMGVNGDSLEQDDVLVEEIPSTSSVDFYPSHRINQRLLELTDADLAITHDDDWRFKLKALNHLSALGLGKTCQHVCQPTQGWLS
ncbi:hypothetical protein BKA70DRAFT_187226 [Coprinopsis sp. MPI-PUGE-AT-0042]|nr:hypothetical protein BKA70DRAFT_187226 [Coprinopsis sp. MPI-PUGE-AT-0042]